MDQSLQSMIAAAAARHALTGLAGFLITNGALSQGDEAKFVQIGCGIVAWGVGFAWSWWQKKGHAALIAQLNSK